MTSLVFPDVNLWQALASPDHVHNVAARTWWDEQSGPIGFTRFTQLGFLRLTTTAAAMDGRPYSLAQAWQSYDHFYRDDRVVFVPEPRGVEADFRRATSMHTVSPKMWADIWLLVVAEQAGGRLVTFDKALGRRGAVCLAQA